MTLGSSLASDNKNWVSYNGVDIIFPYQASAAGFAWNVRDTAVNDAIDETDGTLRVDATAGNIAITLLDITGGTIPTGRIFVIKKEAGAFVVTVSGTQMINGASSLQLPAIDDAVMIQNNGTTWDVIACCGTIGGALTCVEDPPITITTDYNVTINDCFIIISNSVGNVTATLPAIGTVPAGKVYSFKVINFDMVKTASISGNGANIDADSSYSFTTNYESIEIVSNGTQWFIRG